MGSWIGLFAQASASANIKQMSERAVQLCKVFGDGDEGGCHVVAGGGGVDGSGVGGGDGSGVGGGDVVGGKFGVTLC